MIYREKQDAKSLSEREYCTGLFLLVGYYEAIYNEIHMNFPLMEVKRQTRVSEFKSLDDYKNLIDGININIIKFYKTASLTDYKYDTYVELKDLFKHAESIHNNLKRFEQQITEKDDKHILRDAIDLIENYLIRFNEKYNKEVILRDKENYIIPFNLD